MKAIDNFLRRNEVDVGKSVAILVFANAVTKFYSMAAQLIASFQIPFDPRGPIAELTVDFTAPLGIILGIALWRHKPWARTLLLVLAWLSAAFLILMLLAIPFIGTVAMKFKIGSKAIDNPPIWKGMAFAILVIPFFALAMGVLYSKKVKEEFQAPDLRPGPTPAGPVGWT